MAESAIPVDLLNPGHVFASLGVLEVANVLLDGAAGAFDWTSHDATYLIQADGTEPPVERVTRFLRESRIITRAPACSTNVGAWNAKWGDAPVVDADGHPFPFPDPTSPATLPVTLRDDEGAEISIDYWGDATRRDNVKFWGGAAGYPGSALLRDALAIAGDKMSQFASNPLDLDGPQSSSFRFDWRRDYIPKEIGFSKNRHDKVQMIGYPLVEVLAAIGLSHARPSRLSKLEYEYGVLGCGDGPLLAPMFHRAALGGKRSPVPGQPFRRFTMQLDWPAKEGQARCITQVVEQEGSQ